MALLANNNLLCYSGHPQPPLSSNNGNFTQVFPCDLLEPNYPDPNNPRQLLARSEVDRRGTYFECLERELHKESTGYPLVGVVKQCLENILEKRPTAEQLVRVLEGLKEDIEGTCGELTIVDAVRQVKTAMALKKKSKEKVDELTAKDEEIQQLQQQLEVHCTNHPPPHTHIVHQWRIQDF